MLTPKSAMQHMDDRFTGRCRVPAAAMLARGPAMSSYVVVKASHSDERVAATPSFFLCRAALQAPDRSSSAGGCASFDGCVRVPVKLARRLMIADAASIEEERLHWIPQQRIRSAVSVVLDVVSEDAAKVHEYLQGPAYRQLLQDTLRHSLLICQGAIVHLPMPPALASNAGAVASFQVSAVYPDADFVYVTPSSRVTLSSVDEDASAGTEADPIDADELPAQAPVPMAGTSRMGGLDSERKALREMIMMPVTMAELSGQWDIEFPKGLLLCGPPGVGKTLLVRTVVQECSAEVPLLLKVINGSEILTSGIGDAEQTLRNIFLEAAAHARATNGAGVIFIDELDALCPARDTNGTMAHSRIVAQLLTLLDGGVSKHARENVIIVGATNLPNNIDPALRRPGRFDRELFISPPDPTTRKHIFRVHLQDVPLGDDQAKETVLEQLAERSTGYVGADIAALCREAVTVATTRQFVAMRKDQELDRWWSDWKRHGRALTDSNLVSVVSGSAWRANPLAIPLWFLSQQRQSGLSSGSASFFTFLLNGENSKQDKQQSCDQLVEKQLEQTLESSSFQVTMEDFDQAMQVVVASSLRGASGFA